MSEPVDREFSKSVAEIYAEHQQSVREFIAQQVRNVSDAEEILQETFARLTKYGHTLPIKKWEPYLKKTAQNVIYRRHKQAAKEVPLSIPAGGQDELEAQVCPHDGIEAMVVQRDYERLKREQPEIEVEFSLSRDEGMTYREIAEARGISVDQVKRRIIKGRAKLRRRWTTGMVLVVTLIPVLYTLILPQADKTLAGSFVTKLGEYRCESLPEGSQMCLNTDSEARYRFSGSARNVELLRGEVSFVVQKDRRPFDVLAGRVLVHDVSTYFDIYKKDHSTQITVIRGRIRIAAPVSYFARFKFNRAWAQSDWSAAPQFLESQQVVFDEATGRLQSRTTLDPDHLSQVMEWQHGRIDLNGRTLSEALDEFSRYQPIARFIYPKSVGNRLVGGNMEVTHLDTFLEALEVSLGIDYHKTQTVEGTVITLYRRTPTFSTTKQRRSPSDRGALPESAE